MTQTLIGSTALARHINIGRKPKDVDYLSQEPIEGAEVFYHPKLRNYPFGEFATLNELYTIKVSHAFWELKNGSWVKHMKDIILMQEAEAEFLPGLYDILYSIWEERYDKKKANLEESPEDFFKSTVSRVYEHDSIHASVAFYDEPLFNKILRDDHEVAVSKEKFDALSHEDKIKLVKEEVFATALERKIIPSDYKFPAHIAYMWALQKLITSFSKGWFPLWVVLNFKELSENEDDFVATHRENSHKLVPLGSQ